MFELGDNKRNIFIVADDLGLAKPINDGIIFLLTNGSIDGASIMADGEAFKDALEKLKNLKNPNIGIHFVLIEEKPVSKKEAISSLVNKKGRFWPDYNVFFAKYLTGKIKKDDIHRELKAQIDNCVNSGINIKFINSHQHLHLLPGILKIVINLAIEYHIPYIRTVDEPFRFGNSGFIRKIQLLLLKTLSRLAKKKIMEGGLKSNDIFIGFLKAGSLNRSDINLAYELARDSENKIELGCHPGFEDDTVGVKYKNWGNYNWKKELDLLSKYPNH